jgi:Ca2+-binding RTX toxin-like protein
MDGDVALFWHSDFEVEDQTEVYVLAGTTWSSQTALREYGVSVGSRPAISGQTAMVGAYPIDGRSGIRVYVQEGSSWRLQDSFAPDDPGRFEVATALDGDMALVSYSGDDEFGDRLPGVVQVMARSVQTWSQLEELTGPGSIVGTPGDDRILGTAGADVIVGLAGRDRIQGLGGDDVICGGPGNDVLRGSAGNDLVFGDEGADRIWGGGGSDILLGGFGADWIWGGSGGDELYSGNYNDRLFGEKGDDYLNGGTGNDDCDGGDGRDRFDRCETRTN